MSPILITPSGAGESDWFYPKRQRCLGCQRYFGPLVVNRLYDSYACAGLVPPDPDVTTWPRYCRTRVNEPKRRYNCPEEVSERNHEHETIHVYPCDHCGGYHIGHKEPGDTVRERPLAIPRRPLSHLQQKRGRR